MLDYPSLTPTTLSSPSLSFISLTSTSDGQNSVNPSCDVPRNELLDVRGALLDPDWQAHCLRGASLAASRWQRLLVGQQILMEGQQPREDLRGPLYVVPSPESPAPDLLLRSGALFKSRVRILNS